jgi:chitosanase
MEAVDITSSSAESLISTNLASRLRAASTCHKPTDMQWPSATPRCDCLTYLFVIELNLARKASIQKFRQPLGAGATLENAERSDIPYPFGGASGEQVMPNQMSQVALTQALQDLIDAAQRIGSAATQLGQIRAGPAPQMPGTYQAVAADEAVDLAGLTPAQHLICERVINVFETGTIQGNYAAISIFQDGPQDIRQITYGRSQTTEYGNLRELVQMYVDAGARFSEDLREFLPLIGRTALVDNSRFKNLLRQAGAEDPVMRQTQDVFFDRRYFQPAMHWGAENGFTRALSALVIYDSFIHSGSILPLLRARFTELPPARGGNEQVWIRQYVDVRHDWLLNNHRPAVRASAYRTRDLAREIGRGNWDLSLLPIMANGTPVDAGTAIAASAVSSDGIPYLGGSSAADRGAEEGYGEIWGDDAFAAGAVAASSLAAASESLSSLATTILNHPGISLATVHSSGVVDQANARQNIADMAAGGPARRSSYGTAPGGVVMLDGRLLRGMIALAQQYTFSVAEICGGSHNSNSRHYAGLAADFNIVNGRGISAAHPDLMAFKARCRELGATEVLGPGAPHHETHVHAAWPRPM